LPGFSEEEDTAFLTAFTNVLDQLEAIAANETSNNGEGKGLQSAD